MIDYDRLPTKLRRWLTPTKKERQQLEDEQACLGDLAQEREELRRNPCPRVGTFTVDMSEADTLASDELERVQQFKVWRRRFECSQALANAWQAWGKGHAPRDMSEEQACRYIMAFGAQQSSLGHPGAPDVQVPRFLKGNWNSLSQQLDRFLDPHDPFLRDKAGLSKTIHDYVKNGIVRLKAQIDQSRQRNMRRRATHVGPIGGKAAKRARTMTLKERLQHVRDEAAQRSGLMANKAVTKDPPRTGRFPLPPASSTASQPSSQASSHGTTWSHNKSTGGKRKKKGNNKSKEDVFVTTLSGMTKDVVRETLAAVRAQEHMPRAEQVPQDPRQNPLLNVDGSVNILKVFGLNMPEAGAYFGTHATTLYSVVLQVQADGGEMWERWRKRSSRLKTIVLDEPEALFDALHMDIHGLLSNVAPDVAAAVMPEAQLGKHEDTMDVDTNEADVILGSLDFPTDTPLDVVGLETPVHDMLLLPYEDEINSGLSLPQDEPELALLGEPEPQDWSEEQGTAPASTTTTTTTTTSTAQLPPWP